MRYVQGQKTVATGRCRNGYILLVVSKSKSISLERWFWFLLSFPAATQTRNAVTADLLFLISKIVDEWSAARELMLPCRRLPLRGSGPSIPRSRQPPRKDLWIARTFVHVASTPPL